MFGLPGAPKQVPPKAPIVVCVLYLLTEGKTTSSSNALLQGRLLCFARDAPLRKIIIVSLILYVSHPYVKGVVPGLGLSLIHI